MSAPAKRPNPSKKLDPLHYQSPLQILSRAGIHTGSELQKADLLLALNSTHLRLLITN